jgi:plastocyanin
MKFETEYYPINGYLDQYVKNPLTLNQDELLRLYVINIGTTIPYQFHLHSTTFKAYPSGLLSNHPIDAQTIPIGPGDASIIEAQWEYPGTYLFHSHGFQEERGNMGQIVVVGGGGDSNTSNINNQTIVGNEARSTSMFDWQYELQKKLQNPKVVNYTDAQLGGILSINNNSNSNTVAHDNTTTFTHPTANASGAPIPERSLPDEGNNDDNNNKSSVIPSNLEISIVQGSSSLTTDAFSPNPAQVSVGGTVTWTNDDSQPHTATSGENTTPDQVFDSGIMAPAATFEHTFAEAGEFPYFCLLHPNMVGTVSVS